MWLEPQCVHQTMLVLRPDENLRRSTRAAPRPPPNPTTTRSRPRRRCWRAAAGAQPFTAHLLLHLRARLGTVLSAHRRIGERRRRRTGVVVIGVTAAADDEEEATDELVASAWPVVIGARAGRLLEGAGSADDASSFRLPIRRRLWGWAPRSSASVGRSGLPSSPLPPRPLSSPLPPRPLSCRFLLGRFLGRWGRRSSWPARGRTARLAPPDGGGASAAGASAAGAVSPYSRLLWVRAFSSSQSIYSAAWIGSIFRCARTSSTRSLNAAGRCERIGRRRAAASAHHAASCSPDLQHDANGDAHRHVANPVQHPPGRDLWGSRQVYDEAGAAAAGASRCERHVRRISGSTIG